MLILGVLTVLVEKTQNLVKTVVDLSVKAWNLDNNAVVGQAIYKRIGDAPDLLKFTAVILICWQGDRR